MKRSIGLRREPTIRQTRAILAEVERELGERGASVVQERNGALRFRMPRPWRAPRPSPLLAVTSGVVLITASGGGPWRISYDLDFHWLRVLTIAASGILIIFGWSWPRLALLNALALLWAVIFGVLYVAGLVAFQRVLSAAAHEVIERRRTPRDPAGTTPDATA